MKRLRLFGAVALLGLAMGLSGCSTAGGKLKYLADGGVMPDIVGVLPPNNMSNSVAAADTMRKVTSMMMVALGYLPVSSPAQEDELRGKGLTDGGQLRAFKMEELSGVLGVDGLLLINVDEFNDMNVGVYRSRKVVATTTLADARGEKLWTTWAETANRKMVNPMDADAVAKNLVDGLTQKLVEKILRIHLLEEASQTAALAARKSPEWPDTPKEKLQAIKKDLPRK